MESCNTIENQKLCKLVLNSRDYVTKQVFSIFGRYMMEDYVVPLVASLDIIYSSKNLTCDFKWFPW